MAEEETPNRVEEDAPAVPGFQSSLDSLPPPPEIQYTRPISGQSKSDPTRSTGSASYGNRPEDGGTQTTGSTALKLGSGLAAGTTFAASVIAGLLLGQWVDHHWNHAGGTPWGTLIFALVGVAAGFLNLFRVLSATDRNKDRK